MESQSKVIISLNEAHEHSVERVGSKTRNLSLIMKKGFKVPLGFCITTTAYKKFLRKNHLFQVIDLEISRKPPKEMRWEELWDASLRIRSAFLKADIPQNLVKEIKKTISSYPAKTRFSVRSSSPAEDTAQTSYAGIHESYINISGINSILKSIKLVWASLWTDRALLYRDELSLDPLNSSIAVLIQVMEKQPISGLAFSRDPAGNKQHIIIEVVSGYLSNLVDNIKQGEKWIVKYPDLEIEEYINPSSQDKLLNKDQIRFISHKILEIEKIFRYPVDVEWTGIDNHFTILQVRPITSYQDNNEERAWYLTLTPHFEELKKLSYIVEKELIPDLKKEGMKLSQESSNNLTNKQLAEGLKKRAEAYFKWKKIYTDRFIPFAHGIRNLGVFYNDLVEPEDPYEFLELLKNQDLLAINRNKTFNHLAKIISNNKDLKQMIKKITDERLDNHPFEKTLEKVIEVDGGETFLEKFQDMISRELDISYGNISLEKNPQIILKNLYQLSNSNFKKVDSEKKPDADFYLKKLYTAAGESRKKEVDEVLRIGRLSWRLRDDDNILLGKIKNQLLIYLSKGVRRLEKEGRIEIEDKISPLDWKVVYEGLLYRNKYVNIPKKDEKIKVNIDFKPRQLVGQPSSPGIITGRARIIRSVDDFSLLKNGEILVCDAIQPQMTFLLSLASGVVERRGGMLVHSSIIARELGIPAVNGVSKATELIKNGDLVTVNGYLGLVIIGEAEFNLEQEKMEIKE